MSHLTLKIQFILLALGSLMNELPYRRASISKYFITGKKICHCREGGNLYCEL